MDDFESGILLEKTFPPPAHPSALPVTKETLYEELPLAGDPNRLVSSYMQQNLLMKALENVESMLYSENPKDIKWGTQKVLDQVLAPKGGAPNPVQVTFNLNRPDQPRPEVRIGNAIHIDEDHRR
jgi:hypothetical protein